MVRTISEGNDKMLSRDQSGSPQTDEGNCGGTESSGVVLKKGPWTSAEDAILVEYVKKHGEGNWNAVQKHSGLSRCGKSCRLRWANHLRPNLKKGAFTPEEEHLIIELHAKMGNKWARMAAHLPGRTDNEIKNYWNTRIKRHQRAGLPIYPPEVCLQACQENQQNQSADGSYNVDNQQHDLLQNHSYGIPDVFDSLKANQDFLPYIPELPDIYSSSVRMKGLGAHLYSFLPPAIQRPKRLRESVTPLLMYSDCEPASYDQSLVMCENKSYVSFDLPSPYDKGLMPLDTDESNFSILIDNFSASKPTPGAVKLELPSLQTNIGGLGSPPPLPLLESVDAFMQSPPPLGLHQSDCFSPPQNSGLLDALVHEAKTLSNGKHQFSDKSSNSSTVTPGDIADNSAVNMCPAEWKDLGEPISPIFSECTPISTTGRSLEDNLPANTFTGCKVKSEPVDPTWILNGEEKETSTKLDLSRPDVLLGSCLLDHSVTCAKEQGTTDIAALLGVDLGSDSKNMMAGTSLTRKKLGFVSCTWNNMPPVIYDGVVALSPRFDTGRCYIGYGFLVSVPVLREMCAMIGLDG